MFLFAVRREDFVAEHFVVPRVGGPQLTAQKKHRHAGSELSFDHRSSWPTDGQITQSSQTLDSRTVMHTQSIQVFAHNEGVQARKDVVCDLLLCN